MKKGDILTLTIDGYAFEGKGVTRINKDAPASEENKAYVIFVQGAYPGDIVSASIKRIKKTYAEAKAESIITPSPLRIEPRCEYYGTCGGCKQQDLDYLKQTDYKQQQVEEVFKYMGGFRDIELLPIIASERTYYYRNKMEFSFAEKRWLNEEEIRSTEYIDNHFALGLHVPNVFNKVLDIRVCYLQSEVSNRILNFTRNFFKSRNVSIYSSGTSSGYLRNLVIRQSTHTNDLMVNIVTFSNNEPLQSEYVAELLKDIPEVTTIVNNITTKKAMIAAGEFEQIYFGSGYIYDKLGDFKFRISANSFFQTNTLQAEKLYNTAMKFAGLTGTELVYDLYSGAGTIAIYISEKAKVVYGFETVESAVQDAEENKKTNNVSNVHFITADLYKSFLPLINNRYIPAPDVVILDPPRSGMHLNTVNDVAALKPQKIVYVSCNPATQVRDIKLFTEAGYKLIKMQPVDMFPQTYHIENVALLIRETQTK